jgi:hypothetical protein
VSSYRDIPFCLCSLVAHFYGAVVVVVVVVVAYFFEVARFYYGVA